MKSIYKYPISIGETILTMRGRILSAGVQDGSIMIWAVHDDAALARQVRVSVMGTGWSFVNASESDFVGTVFLSSPGFPPTGLVFHVFATVGMIGIEELS